MIPAYPVYLFDLDGTLVDSASDICGAVQQVLIDCGRNDVPLALLKRYIGRHLRDLFLDLNFAPEAIDPMVADYRQIYLARKHSMTSVYPGVPEMLAGLGGRKATATTKGTPTTRSVLERFGLLEHFDHVQGTDGFPAKPEPDVLFKSIEIFGTPLEDCLLIGDSPADMEAGRRAGIKTCAVRWGYGDPVELARWEPDYWLDHPRDILA